MAKKFNKKKVVSVDIEKIGDKYLIDFRDDDYNSKREVASSLEEALDIVSASSL